jgi:hypothetical protein
MYDPDEMYSWELIHMPNLRSEPQKGNDYLRSKNEKIKMHKVWLKNNEKCFARSLSMQGM